MKQSSGFYMTTEIKIYPDADALNQGAAEDFERSCLAAIKNDGRFTCALSGGSTPRSLYRLLAKNIASRLPWTKMHFFWGDERLVPADHPESNYRMAMTEMLSKVPIPEANIHRVKTECGSAEEAAKLYEQELGSFFKGQTVPRFHYNLLGLGENGHTASLFPHSSALKITQRLVVAPYVDELHTYRISLTVPVLNNARRIVFLVSGEKKAPVVREVIEGKRQPDNLPAQLIEAKHGSLCWMLDRAAGYLLKQSTPKATGGPRYSSHR